MQPGHQLSHRVRPTGISVFLTPPGPIIAIWVYSHLITANAPPPLCLRKQLFQSKIFVINFHFLAVQDSSLGDVVSESVIYMVDICTMMGATDKDVVVQSFKDQDLIAP